MAQVREFWEREGRPETGEAPSARDVLNLHAAMRRERPVEPHAAAPLRTSD
jgi:hypothetical protein